MSVFAHKRVISFQGLAKSGLEFVKTIRTRPLLFLHNTDQPLMLTEYKQQLIYLVVFIVFYVYSAIVSLCCTVIYFPYTQRGLLSHSAVYHIQ